MAPAAGALSAPTTVAVTDSCLETGDAPGAASRLERGAPKGACGGGLRGGNPNKEEVARGPSLLPTSTPSATLRASARAATKCVVASPPASDASADGSMDAARAPGLVADIPCDVSARPGGLASGLDSARLFVVDSCLTICSDEPRFHSGTLPSRSIAA